MASVIGVENAVSSASWRRSGGNAPGSKAKRNRKRDAQLASLVEHEILPRLMTARLGDPSGEPVRIAAKIEKEESEAFAPLPLVLEADALVAEVEKFLQRGVDVRSVMIDLLAPSARELGRMWEEDFCNFVDVTMGLWRLQEVMREITWREPVATDVSRTPATAFFCGMPGEQHSFGTLMVAEVFASAGWHCEARIEISRHDLLAEIGSKAFDLVGLTVSCDCPSGELEQLIRAIRSVSNDPQVKVMIGGRAVNERPSLVAECGADGTASDAQSALEFAESLMCGTRQTTALAC